jgi:signal transduction histidine kinase
MTKKLGCFLGGVGIGVAAFWARASRDKDKVFRELLRELTIGPTPDAILQRVAESATKLAHGIAAYVERVDIQRNELTATAVYNAQELPHVEKCGPYRGSVAEHAIHAGHPVRVRDISRSHSILASLKQHSAIVLPLVTEGEALGALVLIQGRKAINARALYYLQTMADIASVSLRRAIMFEELQRSMRTREEMLRVLAHDLRNPVNTIAMAAASLDNPSIAEQTRTGVIQIINRSTWQMNRLIQDLIDNVVIEHSGKLPLNPQDEAADVLTQEVCELSRIQAKTKTVNVECQIEGRATVYADRSRLLQVLMNLIDNAIKFTPEGGTVTVKSEFQRDEVRFSVSDTGPGISETDRPRIFEPYWQAPATAHLGAGLGLAIAKQIVEQHGGKIWVEGAEGHGSTFVFTIPATASN